VAFALPNPSAIRQALAEVARSANCALPRFSVSGEGQVGVTGPVGAGAPETALREAVDGVAPHAPVTWRMRGFDGPYCAALDLVRPIAQPSGPFLGLNLKDEATIIKDHQPIVPMLRLPEFPAHLIVDYLSHDGSVTHLFPTAVDHDKAFAANAAVTLGPPGKGVGEAGPPFGTDMIVAVASSVPLFAQRRPADGETAETYLPALRAAIEAAQQRNAKVAGRAIVLETVEH
jgi:serine/threonine-protein kinase